MSPREGRTRPVTPGDVQTLIDRSRALLVAADLLVDDDQDLSALSAAAAVAVLAGIAAADALCGIAVGRRSRDADHRAAVDLLTQATPGHPELPRALSSLLDVKDTAHYGTTLVKHPAAVRAVRHARSLLHAARQAQRG